MRATRRKSRLAETAKGKHTLKDIKQVLVPMGPLSPWRWEQDTTQKCPERPQGAGGLGEAQLVLVTLPQKGWPKC